MIIPIRCFSCGQLVADKYDQYLKLINEDKKTPNEALDSLGVKKYCCRRMLLSHVESIDEIMRYN
ncbi:MAG: DNA-directed RNA polymerase subunit N [archaeon]|jgi:DNA-directed RNA polymerase I, II, and III subunit RPABC5|nr:DNA-directed RNA polymerase subunit N [archaeon]MDD2477606.1 DNA-directed RNA polymerase subunit N [Candidatus ainarchaeum sp.]MDD3084299.1 DNA-directed RNA polymerase subunit N [Candidatus ainarchaeum sp.]MDD4221040.1 DNA-directed RNA polymerase subunit N [Candidatus ainarchaeum sp.]MDD4662512.1 DNA-directed RNA polymerase subunit N [Candidatus ainarchaeum sp.]